MSLEQLVTVICVLSIVCFTGGAILALRWGLNNGQFDHSERSATTIFDFDEPIGEPTDRVLKSSNSAVGDHS